MNEPKLGTGFSFLSSFSFLLFYVCMLYVFAPEVKIWPSTICPQVSTFYLKMVIYDLIINYLIIHKNLITKSV